MKVVMLCPEPPYPLNGGGALRTASIVNYFARFADVDLILFSSSGQPARLPHGLVRSMKVIPLPAHSHTALARWRRNAFRAARGVPPLVDRLSGHDAEVREALRGRRYDLGIVEHSWCAPYLPLLAEVCDRTLLDMHNIESVLHQRAAAVSGPLVAAGHRRFAAAMRRLEAEFAPRYSFVATTSQRDAESIRGIAPGANVIVYPNALPALPLPQVAVDENLAVFSGNFEYHPNIDAVDFLIREIWPEVRRRHPSLRLRLVGRGAEFIRHLIAADSSIEVTGPVENALAEIARAQIVLAPLRVGSGTRLKILEAWQAGRPVIATPLAAEGLQTTDPANLLLAESASAFADGIDRLRGDAELRSTLSLQGRKTLEDNYTWQIAWRSLDALFRVTNRTRR